MDVQLRPVTEGDLDRLEEMWADPAALGEFNWQGWQSPRRWRQSWAETRLLEGDRRALMITAVGEPAGFITWRPSGPPPMPCWEIGISLWPHARGKGVGAEAHRLLVRYLFETTLANRVQAITEAGNVAEQRSLEKAGFRREGVLRGYRYRAGQWRDEVIYGITRADVGPPP